MLIVAPVRREHRRAIPRWDLRTMQESADLIELTRDSARYRLRWIERDSHPTTGGVSASFDLVEPHIRSALRQHVFGKPAGEVPLPGAWRPPAAL